MQTRTQVNDKNSAYKLSTQVKNILHEKGLSFLFTYNDYKYFKIQVKNKFNQANEIANLFIQYHEPNKNDYNDYVF
jgi:hypothetical protein